VSVWFLVVLYPERVGADLAEYRRELPSIGAAKKWAAARIALLNKTKVRGGTFDSWAVYALAQKGTGKRLVATGHVGE
jgi:hypothetical protein